MESDGSAHVKLMAFSSYMSILQIAIGHEQMQKMRPEHQITIVGYLSDLFDQVHKAT